MTTYDHTQKGVATLAVVALGVALLTFAAISAVLGTEKGAGPEVILPFVVGLVIVGLILVVFTRLRVRIDEGALHWAFGMGWPKYSLPLADIEAARAVKNNWLYGYGIRIIPKGTLYNISGSDAVELIKRDGKMIRIGTDEPAALLAAIEASRMTSNPGSR